MACSNCSSSSPLSAFELQMFYSNQCFDCQDSNCGGSILNAKCVLYTGANLSCSGIETNDTLETALQKIDEQICTISGDFTSYDLNCLPTWYGQTIDTEAKFVSAITGYACEINSTLSNFVDVTFAAYQTQTGGRLSNLENPALTCSSAGVVLSDNLSTIINKYCTKFSAIDTTLNISSVVWNNCYSVVGSPSTMADAFTLVLDQICQTKALITNVALPTFNNTIFCESGGTSNDSLTSTINLIKTRVCKSPVFDNTLLASDCVSIPSTSTDLQSLLQNLLSKVDVLSKNYVTFDNGDFSVTQTGSSTCDGISVSLATPINQDRFVAVNTSDSAPSTLINKIVGVGIAVDDTTNPGQITLTSTATTDTFQLKAGSPDSTPDFLDAKVSGGSDSGVTISTSYNNSTKKVDILPSINLSQLFDALLDELEINTELYEKFCERVANCPSPCDAPSNVQVVAGEPSTTTTTTLP